jgi:hypothetical protein
MMIIMLLTAVGGSLKGCGRHIEQALAGLSKDQICTCKDKTSEQHKDLKKPTEKNEL